MKEDILLSFYRKKRKNVVTGTISFLVCVIDGFESVAFPTGAVVAVVRVDTPLAALCIARLTLVVQRTRSLETFSTFSTFIKYHFLFIKYNVYLVYNI